MEIVIRRGVREKMKWLTEMLVVVAVSCMVMLHCLEDKSEVRQPELVRIDITHVVTPDERNVHDIARKYLREYPELDYPRVVFAIRHVNGMLDNKRALKCGDRITIPLLLKR
jgi:hypothetical protein